MKGVLAVVAVVLLFAFAGTGKAQVADDHFCGDILTNAPCSEVNGQPDNTARPVPPGYKLETGSKSDLRISQNVQFMRNTGLPVKGARLDVEKFTPREFGRVEWFRLGDNESTTFWYAFKVDEAFGTYIMLKSGTKALGNNSYTMVSVISGFGDCRSSATGDYPAALWNAQLEKFSAANGVPSPGFSEPASLGELPVERGNALADAVKRSCDAVAAR